MNEMFKDWSFWKPIVIYIGVIVFYFTLLIILLEHYSTILAYSSIIAFFLYMFYCLGKSHYNLHQTQIRNNYKKLTSKNYDDIE
jgi:hypothetical protein